MIGRRAFLKRAAVGASAAAIAPALPLLPEAGPGAPILPGIASVDIDETLVIGEMTLDAEGRVVGFTLVKPRESDL